jgi:hypothetical protein
MVGEVKEDIRMTGPFMLDELKMSWNTRDIQSEWICSHFGA